MNNSETIHIANLSPSSQIHNLIDQLSKEQLNKIVHDILPTHLRQTGKSLKKILENK